MAPRPGTISPYSCMAQHVSLYAEKHCCSWLPKCSGVNATRHRATRRDTHISPSRDQHRSRDTTLRGKRHASPPNDHNPRQGVGIGPVLYLAARMPAGSRPGGDTRGGTGCKTTVARCFDASLTAGSRRDLSTNSATTRHQDVGTYLDHRLGQYLAAYLLQGLRIYRPHDVGDNHIPSRRHDTETNSCQHRAAYRSVWEQTNSHHDSTVACRPVWNTIVTDILARVAHTTISRADLPIRTQTMNAVECQAVPGIPTTVTQSVRLFVSSPVCITARPHT